MQLAIVGLGKMGGNMARRLAKAGDVELVLMDRDPALTERLATELHAVAAADLDDVVRKLHGPRHLWLMLPAGGITQSAVDVLAGLLKTGDTIIEGGNSLYKESQTRAAALKERGIHYLDVGVSGGIWGEKNGYALMIGGDPKAARKMEPIFKRLAPAEDRGWLYCGPSGAGHFVKMIHNGIEYGMMQAFAEGFSLMRGKADLELDLGAIAEMWRHGSVVRSWLLDLTAEFLQKDADLENIAPLVADSGEGRWTVNESIEQGIPTPVMTQALFARFASQGKDDFGARLLAMMRKGFGGHSVQSGK